MLTAIKLVHTSVWAILAASIIALPVMGLLRRFKWAWVLTVLVLVECGALALNGGRCPLSDLAARFTEQRTDNFDIYLPNWLARHNNAIFGTLFVSNELIVLWCWPTVVPVGSSEQCTRRTRRPQTVMQIVKAGVLYFAFVFGAGFVLGTIRTIWIVPIVARRMAELMEDPFMFVVIIVAARSIIRRLAVPFTPFRRFSMGLIALALLLVVEFTLVLSLRGLSIREYLATRDPVSGTVYYIMLGLFAIMPILVARKDSGAKVACLLDKSP